MEKKLCLIICENFEKEAVRALASGEYPDIEVSTFPAFHLCKSVDWGRLEGVLPAAGEYSSVRLVGGSCLNLLGDTPGRPESCEIDTTDQCFELFAPQELVDEKIREGAYLVTPGWLSLWKRHLDDWGFDRRGAREFFSESMRSVLLLDTGVDPEAEENLRDFASFVGLPRDVSYVGLDLFKANVESIALKWRLELERQRIGEELASASRKAADLAMIFDLISEIALVAAEDRVVDSIFELFSMLFAPERMVLHSMDGGKVRGVRSRPEGIVDGCGLEGAGEEALPPVCSAGETGFRVKIPPEGDTLAVLDVCDVALPEYEERYQEAARSVAAVCGLAISNARTYRALELANVELSGFAHTVSHDLKGPLAAILLSADTLRELIPMPDDPAKSKEIDDVMGIIERNVARSNSLIVDLLSLAEAGEVPLDVSPVDVRRVLDSAAGEKAFLLEERGALLELTGDFGEVRASPAHLYQVFANLIGNAVKHARADSLVITVEGLGEGPPGAHRYRVRDNGRGIPEEEIDKVFVPFFKGRSSGDTGVGLSTVRKIVEAYRGDIKAYNDGGACFEFTLRDAP